MNDNWIVFATKSVIAFPSNFKKNLMVSSLDF